MDPCPHRWRKRLYDVFLFALLVFFAVGALVVKAYEPHRDLVHAVLFGVAVMFFSLRTIPRINHWFGFDVHGPRTDERDHLIMLNAQAHTLNILMYVVAVWIVVCSLLGSSLSQDVAISSLLVLWISMNWMPTLIKDHLNTRM